MIIPYLKDLEIPDVWFDTQTSSFIEDYLENWCKDNWVKDESVSVSPLMDKTILFGCKFTEGDWREYYANL
jgi:hypothetical protein